MAQLTGKDKSPRFGAIEIIREASVPDTDEITRQIRRGKETGNADDRDVAGAVKSEDTPHGREETKKRSNGGKNSNGGR